MEKNRRTNILIYGIISLLVSSPLIYLKITIDIFEFQKLILSFFIFLSYLLLIFYNFKFIKPNKNFRFWVISITILLLIIIISNIVNEKNDLILKQIFYWINIINISLIIYSLYQESNENFLIIISKIIIIPAIIISILGILQLVGLNILGELTSSRPGSLMNTRNFVCDYLLIIIPFILFLFIISQKRLELLLYGVIILIINFYMFSLRSRTAFLIITFYLISLIIIRFVSKHFINKNYTLKIFIFLIIVITSFFLSKFELPFSDPERKSMQTILKSFSDYKYPPNISRLFYYDACVKMFIENPIFGIGSGAWAGYFGKYQGDEFNDITTYNNSAIFAHNDFLEYLGETGFLGFIVFLTIFLYPILILMKRIKSEIYYFPFLLSLLGFFIICLISFPKENINLMFIVVICIVISFGVNENRVRIDYFNKYLLIVISFIVLIFNFLRVYSEREYINAMRYKGENKYSEMIYSLEKINRYIYSLDPNKIPINYYLGIGHYINGNYLTALNCFEDAIKLMPYFPQIISNKATTLYSIGEKEKSENLLLELKRKFPYYYESQINLLVLYMKEKRFTEAENLIYEIENKEKGEKYRFAKNFNTFLRIKKELNEAKDN